MRLAEHRNKQGLKWYLFGCLLAVELLMSFSFLGYLHIEPISITFAYIPIMIAGCLLGPLESAVLGLVFGLSSMWKASASYVMAGDKIFSPILSGYPVKSFLLSVGSRVLFGFVIGLLYYAAKRTPRFRLIWIGIISALGKLLHAAFVYGFMAALFPEAGYYVWNAFDGFFQWDNLVTIVVTVAVIVFCWWFEHLPIFQRFQQRMETAQKLRPRAKHHYFSALAIAVLLFLSIAVVVYFIQRMEYMFRADGLALSQTAYFDLLHLQIQFLLGVLSLVFLAMIVLTCIRKYTAYTYYEARKDALTGLFDRKGFFQICENFLRDPDVEEDETGYFLILDLDNFKQINDRYGHPFGDEVLRQAAGCLIEVFGNVGVVGRLGGDEFVVLVHTPIVRAKMELDLKHFMKKIHQIPCQEGRVSCSIGVRPIESSISADLLYRYTDELLYKAKQQGRDRFIIADKTGKQPLPDPLDGIKESVAG